MKSFAVGFFSLMGLGAFCAGNLTKDYENHQSSVHADMLLTGEGELQEPEMSFQEYVGYRLDMAQTADNKKKFVKRRRSLPQLMGKIEKINKDEDKRVPELFDVIRLMRDEMEESAAGKSMKALARIGTKDALDVLYFIATRPGDVGRDSSPNQMHIYKCNLAKMAIDALKEADAAFAHDAVRNSECNMNDVFVADGTEEGLQYLMEKNEPRKLADFVIANHQKPFMQGYRTMVLGLLSDVLDRSTDTNFPYNCNSNSSAPVYAEALYVLDPLHAESFVNSMIRGKYCSNINQIDARLDSVRRRLKN